MNIQERKNRQGQTTSYRIRVFDHRDIQTGKQVFRTLSVKYDNTKSESWNKRNAEKQGIIFEKQISDQTVSYTNTPFYSYCEYAINVKANAGLSSSTIYSYNSCLKKIAPYLGHIKLRLLTPVAINKAYSEMEKNKIPRPTIYQCHLFIHSMLQAAFKENLIPRNYADAASPPKYKKKEPKVLTEHEINRFFTILYSERKHYLYQVLFTVLLASGCRIGELCALTWKDIDFERKRIHICKHFITDDSGTYIHDGAKTYAGDRWLYMDDVTMDILKEFRIYYLKTAMKYEKDWNFTANAVFFCERKRGNFLSPAAVRAWLRKFSCENGFGDIHPHIFRHTSVSLQLAAGISITDASRRAGHSRPDVTLRIYSHIINENDAHCCEAVTKAIPQMPKNAGE